MKKNNNFTMWKINILQSEKLLNILSIPIISKKWKNEFENKAIDWSFVILIFANLKFGNIGVLHFVVSKFDPQP